MRSRSPLALLVCTGALLGIGAAACDSVLDIQDPMMRPGDAGAAGEPGAGNANSGGALTTPQGGESGAPEVTPAGGSTPVEGGAGGEGGSPTPPECEEDAVQCGGEGSKSPQVCRNGRWTQNLERAEGECPVLCAAGACTECEGDLRRCSVCEEGDAACSSNRPQKCVDGHWQDEAKECAHYCNAGECGLPPSCPNNEVERSTCQGESCCRSLRVEGGSFSRDYDGSDYFFAKDQYPATISPFLLDKYEVTVGRMKQFVTAYNALILNDGDGKSTYIATDAGWKKALALPSDSTKLVEALACADQATWADNESTAHFPANCVNFNVAYAFCIWDGGRLPTEAEWNYAAAGGSEQRVYPWKPALGAADPISPDHAVYDSAAPALVGSKPAGNARWGHADLAGNVSEWTLDFAQDYPETCHDCLSAAASNERAVRGGAFPNIDVFLFAAYRSFGEPTETIPERGFRCARELK